MDVFLIAALSADGFIAQDPGQISTDWTSQADKKWFSQKTKEAGVCIFGRKTYKTFARPLAGRLSVVMTRDVSSFELESMVDLSDHEVESLLKDDELMKSGLVVYSNLSAEKVLSRLLELGFDSVAICGGAQIYSLFTRSGLVKKFFLTLEPVFFGEGTRLFAESNFTQLRLVEQHRLSDQTVVMEYQDEG